MSGYVALFSRKGVARHRRAGQLFVGAMLAMAAFALLDMAVTVEVPRINVVAATLTAYLVVTGLTAVRPPARGAWPLHLAGLLIATAIGAWSLVVAADLVRTGARPYGVPPFPYFLFGGAALLAAAGDARVPRAGAMPAGAARLARHLWRVTFALFVAALSFFLGQADEFPAWLRATNVQVLPVLAVLASLLYWLWKVRVRRAFTAPLRVRES